MLEATIESLRKIIQENNLSSLLQEDANRSEMPVYRSQTENSAICSPGATPTTRRVSTPDTTMSQITDEAGLPPDKEAGPSPSEAQIAGAVSQDGDIEVHGVASMFHRHRQSITEANASQVASSAERERQNQASRARLVANAAVQKQREAIFLRSPHMAANIDFDGIDPELAVHLIDVHFNRTHFTYLISYRPAITDSLISNGPYCNKILLNAIYLSSSLYSDRVELRSNPADSQSAGDRFYRRLRTLLVDHIDKPSIPTAVGLLLCGAALVSTGRPSAGWIQCGIAYRMIIDLGCHLTVESRRGGLTGEMALLTDMELEIRKRLYWGAFLTDATQSLYFGRPPCLRASQARVPQLLLDTYEELEGWAPYVDPLSTSSSSSSSSSSNDMSYTPRPAYAISTFNAMVRLFEISSRIAHTFYSIHSLKHSSQHIRNVKTAIQLELEHWFTSLPGHLQFNPDKDPTPPPHQITPLYVFFVYVFIRVEKDKKKEEEEKENQLTPKGQLITHCRSSCSARSLPTAI